MSFIRLAQVESDITMTSHSRLVDGLATVHDRLEAARPMAAGGLATHIMLRLVGDPAAFHGAIKPIEYGLLGFFVAELALAAAVTNDWSIVRGVEAAVLVPYVLLLVVGSVAHSVLGCSLPAPWSGLKAVVAPAHESLVVCRELYALEVVAGVGVAAEARTAVVDVLEWPDQGPFG